MAGHQLLNTGPGNGIFPITMICLGCVRVGHFSVNDHCFSDVNSDLSELEFTLAIYRQEGDILRCGPTDCRGYQSHCGHRDSGLHSLSEWELGIWIHKTRIGRFHSWSWKLLSLFQSHARNHCLHDPPNHVELALEEVSQLLLQWLRLDTLHAFQDQGFLVINVRWSGSFLMLFLIFRFYVVFLGVRREKIWHKEEVYMVFLLRVHQKTYTYTNRKINQGLG